MSKLSKEFVSNEKRHFKYHVGNMVASSLSGFIGGIIITLIIIFALCDVVLKS